MTTTNMANSRATLSKDCEKETEKKQVTLSREGEIMEIFKALSDEEKGSGRGSFNLEFLEGWLRQGGEGKEGPYVSIQASVENLRKVCVELLESSKRSKGVIDRLVNDGMVMKRKMQELEKEADIAKKEVELLKGELGETRQNATICIK